MLVFVVNGVMLASKANACTMERPPVAADMPDCHKSQNQQNEQKPKGDHCDGVCFCQHVGASNHILALSENIISYHSIAAVGQPTSPAFMHVIDHANLLRPPISLS